MSKAMKPLDLAAAAAIALLTKGRISLAEIEAIPCVRGRREAIAVANRLLRSFGPRCRVDHGGGYGIRLRLSGKAPEAQAKTGAPHRNGPARRKPRAPDRGNGQPPGLINP